MKTSDENPENVKPPAPKPPVRKEVAIKFGDVAFSVEGESQEKVKQDAMDIFTFLEKQYGKSVRHAFSARRITIEKRSFSRIEEKRCWDGQE